MKTIRHLLARLNRLSMALQGETDPDRVVRLARLWSRCHRRIRLAR